MPLNGFPPLDGDQGVMESAQESCSSSGMRPAPQTADFPFRLQPVIDLVPTPGEIDFVGAHRDLVVAQPVQRFRRRSTLG
ncbi:MAG: hypothetical protein AUH29_05725 [Candidatus Rokubacteria bacterium 13_1_40CM_69_27]|nr:MAG: hypothetical protein AUH29_05725 [Candidatus Rokubacteria bacterium 13_1_40CM_69_27]